jgi:hypothetical protein
MSRKSSYRRRHRVVRLPVGNVPSAEAMNVAEGATSRHGITVDLNEEAPKRRRPSGDRRRRR